MITAPVEPLLVCYVSYRSGSCRRAASSMGAGGSSRRWIWVFGPIESSSSVFTPEVRLMFPPAIRSKFLR